MSILDEGGRLGEWTVGELLGEGGNGEVWRAVRDNGDEGALKVIRNQNPQREPLARFRREVATLRALTGRPGILPLLDAEVPENLGRRDRVWYVMSLAEPLRPAMAGATTVEVVAAIAGIARALSALHVDGIAHRDIKPENLYLWSGSAAVGDFGLVSLPDATTLRQGDRVPGSFGYIADELLLDPDADGRPGDVFALAKVLWVLLYDEAFPVQGALVVGDNPAALGRKLNHPRAEELDRILVAATSHVDRRLTMQAFASDLNAWLEGPHPSEPSAPLEAALARAHAALLPQRDQRSALRSAQAAAADAVAMIRGAAGPLFGQLTALDPSALCGSGAVGEYAPWILEPDITGGAEMVATEHFGIRLQRDQGIPKTLLLAFSVQVSIDGRVYVDGLGLATVTGIDVNPDLLGRRVAEQGALMVQRNIEQLIASATEWLPGALNSFVT